MLVSFPRAGHGAYMQQPVRELLSTWGGWRRSTAGNGMDGLAGQCWAIRVASMGPVVALAVFPS